MEIKNRITRFSNLEENNSLSGYDGYTAQQHQNAYQVFYDFLSETAPARILEIGTGQGGFTRFLRTTCNELELNTEIRTFDISLNRNETVSGIQYSNQNIFNDNWSTADQDAVSFIQGDGVTVVLCDGGWKVGEFNILSNYIKPGDFILGHDYAENEEIFQQSINKVIWNWHELKLSDVSPAIERNNLTEYKKEIFSNAAWLCTKKNLH
tara:strand:+ start:1003 stop:1629 length:627 start_codon:yes stop_codon:yes gene_type:complete